MTPQQDKLVVDNYNLTYFYLHKFGYSIDEYLDIATIGLCKAALTYDPDKGAAFSTWALMQINFAVLQERRREARRLENNAGMTSLDAPTTPNGDAELKNIIPGEPTDFSGPEAWEFLKTLSDDEREIVNGALSRRRQSDTAAMLGMNQVAVSRALQRVREKYIKFLGGYADYGKRN